MTFQEAMTNAEQGMVITREGLDFQLKAIDNALYVLDENGEYGPEDRAQLLMEDYLATDWKVVTNDEVVAYFDQGKRRWVSTTNVEKHKALQHEVAVFKKVRTL